MEFIRIDNLPSVTTGISLFKTAIYVTNELDILALLAPISQNGQTHSSNSSVICRRIVWVCLTILWYWHLKGWNDSLVIRRKGESQNEGNKKIKHVKFFEKQIRFTSALRIALLPYHRWIEETALQEKWRIPLNINLVNVSKSADFYGFA